MSLVDSRLVSQVLRSALCLWPIGLYFTLANISLCYAPFSRAAAPDEPSDPRTQQQSERQSQRPSQQQAQPETAQVAEQAVRLLTAKCVSCHGAEQAEAGLRLDSQERLLTGGDRGPAFIENKVSESLLFQSIAGLNAELKMPPKNPLTKAEVELIRSWLERGAPWPAKSDSAEMHEADSPQAELGDAWTDPRNPIVKIFGGQRLDLWSLKGVNAPPLPTVANDAWARNEIDRFVLASFEREQIAVPKAAGRHELVRRLYFDLTGLPPTPEAAAEFESSGDPQEVERLVDRLLESDRFGEHWARMWLDVVRYSDSNGFDWDEFRPQAWRFRDYVIRSFNADKPFDQFIREQLAGDELFAGNPQDASQQDALLATGFLRLGPHDNAAKLFNEQDRSRDELLTDLVETTGSAFLGMTLSCCRCHDHKYDPLSHADHFRIRACFAGVEFADDLPVDLDKDQQEIDQHNAAMDEQIATLESRKSEVLEAIRVRLLNASTATTNATTDSGSGNDKPASDASTFSADQLRELATEDEQAKLKEYDAAISQAKQGKRSKTHAMLMVERDASPPPTFVLFQGDYKSPRQEVEPGVFSALNPNPLTAAASARTSSGGRRLALADWIASPENPLTARVLVNRVWQQLLGQGIVATSGDFGLAGDRPSEPELLDWMAFQFVKEGWSVKRLVRMIVLSAAYQQASAFEAPPESIAHLVHRPRRLTAEQLRDSMLHISGLLTAKTSGPPEWPELPKDVLEANPAFLDDNETKTKGWYPSPEDSQHCRSIFLVQKRNTRIPLLETFDQPENSVSCTRRLCSVVAPQALSLLNSPEAVRAARSFANRVTQGASSTDEQIELAFSLALQRPPSASERTACQQLIQQTDILGLCRVLLNVNEFAYID